MKYVFFLLLILIIHSCKSKARNLVSTNPKIEKASILEDTSTSETTENLEISKSKSKIAIDYNKNKVLLDIILLLPDSVFSSWDWNLNDRIKWYKEIKKNNYYIDDNPDYFNQTYFEPNKAGFTIVDGFWSINIYKTVENSYIVITDDIVGDGHSLNFYEVKSNTIKSYLDEKIIFSDFEELLKKKEIVEPCEEKYEELSYPIFNFDFTNKNKVEIESAWYLTKDDYEKCLIGNAIIYNFNSNSKKFMIEKIYWKAKSK